MNNKKHIIKEHYLTIIVFIDPNYDTIIQRIKSYNMKLKQIQLFVLIFFFHFTITYL